MEEDDQRWDDFVSVVGTIDRTRALAARACAELAQTVREIALVYPRNKRRWFSLRETHLDLFEKAAELELVCEDTLDDEMYFDYKWRHSQEF